VKVFLDTGPFAAKIIAPDQRRHKEVTAIRPQRAFNSSCGITGSSTCEGYFWLW